MKHSLEKVIKDSLVRIDFGRLVQRVRGPSIAILRYHSVRIDPEAHADTIGSGIIHPAGVFEQQMSLLSRRYRILTMDDVLDFARGVKAPSGKCVVVSFDDGFDDNHDVAAGILHKYGISGVFYVTVDCIERKEPLWFVRLRTALYATAASRWTCAITGKQFPLCNQFDKGAAFLHACRICATLSGSQKEEYLKTIEREVGAAGRTVSLMMEWHHVLFLSSAGHTIGSHTMTHPNLAHLEDPDALQYELQASKDRLESVLKKPVRHFSYPSPILKPHWNERTIRAVRDAGYETAVTCTPGAVRKGDETLCLKRISAPLCLDEFAWKIDCALAGIAV